MVKKNQCRFSVSGRLIQFSVILPKKTVNFLISSGVIRKLMKHGFETRFITAKGEFNYN